MPATLGRASAPARRRTSLAAAAVLVTAGLAGCDASPADLIPGDDATAAGKAARVKVRLNSRDTTAVPVDRLLRVRAARGTLRRVRVTSEAGALPGKLSGSAWRATERLEPGTDYVVRTVSERADGTVQRDRSQLHTQDLTLDEQTFAAVAPLEGETVGVGMPVIVSFDVAVTDKAAFERHMRVTSEPAQPGTWHWLSDREAHWRPRTYWKPGTDVTVDLDLNSLPAGGGVYGQEDRTVSFDIGDSVIHRVDAAAHVMKTYINGALARTTPVSAGKPGFETRSGTKVVIEKHRFKTMDAATTGIAEGDPEYYNIEDVEYALRVTYSGEFLHAAPWSVGSQGSANVSHGCVGMSTRDAAWVYDVSKRGDVVEVTGTDRWMDLTNGYGDWNASYADYKAGSALG
ncbi:hypothetical protein DDE18_10190 [Nocardioides gansuensis]|uniref:L,D-TPase catalytic domain-containing protein n=1 Tax=Nocardioides gansuensis TaxID=2138300 RepID=A0A2T8FAL9_9ACTN|nr:Ig-like domain-containing protein [Nocardioides gansuensis]PVG82725.1 hypothetical protein DDE18_10190 [Nocardioides gansuensis]